MTRHIVGYVAAALVLFALDMLWLRVIAVDWYRQGIGHLMAGDVNLVAGSAFYLLFPVGLAIFAIVPNMEAASWRAGLMGALFGFFAYATYDLTNLATLKAWPVGLSALDVMWGTLASGVSAAAGRWAAAAI